MQEMQNWLDVLNAMCSMTNSIVLNAAGWETEFRSKPTLGSQLPRAYWAIQILLQAAIRIPS